jgi:hypothetical protein
VARHRQIILFAAATLAGIVTVGVAMVAVVRTRGLIYDMGKSETIASKKQKEIEQEFGEISPLPNAVVVQQSATHRTERGIISSAYTTRSSYESIKEHYNHELTVRGWQFQREADVQFDGRNYGGKELIYCTNDYVGSLQFAGRQESEFGWTFSFALTWGNAADECK